MLQVPGRKYQEDEEDIISDIILKYTKLGDDISNKVRGSSSTLEVRSHVKYQILCWMRLEKGDEIGWGTRSREPFVLSCCCDSWKWKEGESCVCCLLIIYY